MTTLDLLRARCAWAAGETDHVTINAGKIAEYTQFILDKYPLITAHDENHLVSGAAEETAAYAIALGGINFGSGYFKATGLEYKDIAGGLKDAFLRGEMNAASSWARATAEECKGIFLSCPPGRSEGSSVVIQAAPPKIPRDDMLEKLMGLFARHLNATGRVMLEQYQGRMLNFVAAAGGSAAKLVDIVSKWETYRDVSIYKGREIPFLKRAQLLAAHLELTGLPEFSDMDALTCFADNMVPHVLRCDGILEYAPALAARIDGGEFIAAGSAEEVEIRATAIHAVELMKAAAGAGVTATNIDHLLWNRGYEPEIYARPSHQTMTEWY